jgi:uncharacterized protein (TIGR03663 family)
VKTTSAAWLLLALAVAVGLGVRLYGLTLRPMHADEAEQALMTARLIEGESYAFDPHHFHGPMLSIVTIPFAEARGQRTYAELDEFTLRFLPALIGALMPLALFPVRRELGTAAYFWAGLFGALSPGLVYYSRYHIHEMFLVFFSALFLGSVWQWAKAPSLRWAVAVGALAGLTHATKETCVFVWCSAALALFATGGRSAAAHCIRNWRQILSMIAVSLFVSCFLYSRHFTALPAFWDSLRTWFVYKTAAGHHQPWPYYLGLLSLWSTKPLRVGADLPLVLLALGGCAVLLAGRAGRRFAGFAGAYGLILLFLYSLVPYKTPWLLASVLQAFTVPAGDLAARLVGAQRSVSARVGGALVLLVAIAALGCLSWRTNVTEHSSERNAYAYSATSEDIVELQADVDRYAKDSGLGSGMRIQVVGSSLWPLPWYLRKYPATGYLREVPPALDAPVVIAGLDLAGDVEPLLGTDYRSRIRGVRQEVPVVAWYRTSPAAGP